MQHRRIKVIESKTLEVWRDAVYKLEKDKHALALILNIQDGGPDVADGTAAKLDCAKERWLMRLFPVPAEFEDPTAPPDRCAKFLESEWRNDWEELDSPRNSTPVAQLSLGAEPFEFRTDLIVEPELPLFSKAPPVVVFAAYHKTGIHLSQTLGDALMESLKGPKTPPHTKLNIKVDSWSKTFPSRGEPSNWFNWSRRSHMNLEGLERMLSIAEKEPQKAVYSCAEPILVEAPSKAAIVHFVRHPVDSIVSAYLYHREKLDWWVNERAWCNFCAESDRMVLFVRCGFQCSYGELLDMHSEEDGVMLEFFNMRLSIQTMLANMQAWANDPRVLHVSSADLEVDYNQTMACIALFLRVPNGKP